MQVKNLKTDETPHRQSRLEQLDLVGFGRRLERIAQGNWSEFSRLSGVSKPSLLKYRDGKAIPGMDALVAIATAGHVSLEFLVTGRDVAGGGSEAGDKDGGDIFVKISLIDVSPTAGRGRRPIGDDSCGHIQFPKAWFDLFIMHDHHARAAYFVGRSMEPTIQDGGLILIDITEIRPVDGRIFFFRVGEFLFVKRLKLLPSGWQIVSDNPEFQSSSLPAGEKMEIFGRVLWTERRL